MKSLHTILVLGALIAGVSGIMLTADGFPTTPFATAGVSPSLQENPVKAVGHITLTAYGPDGQIKHYVQTDNTVLNDGMNCLANLVFGATVTSDTCGSTAALMDDIAIGNGNDGGGVAATQTALTNEIQRAAATSVTAPAASSSVSTTSLSKQFTFTTGIAIDEAGLTNASTNGTQDFLAIQEFTAIPLTSSDSLTVQWDIQLG